MPFSSLRARRTSARSGPLGRHTRSPPFRGGRFCGRGAALTQRSRGAGCGSRRPGPYSGGQRRASPAGDVSGEACHDRDSHHHDQRPSVGRPVESRRRRRRATSTAGCSAGTSRSIPDPQYGGYALAKINGIDVAGIGPQQSPDSPVAWSFYIGTKDAAGAWQQGPGGRRQRDRAGVRCRDRRARWPSSRIRPGRSSRSGSRRQHGRLPVGRPEHVRLGRTQLARPRQGRCRSTSKVFGWGAKEQRPVGGGGDGGYTEFQQRGREHRRRPGDEPDGPAAGAQLLGHLLQRRRRRRGVPEGDRPGRPGAGRAQEFPGGRFAIVADPQGASFGLLKLVSR